jgi:RNA polymerase sigma factor (sigma-70 family)
VNLPDTISESELLHCLASANGSREAFAVLFDLHAKSLLAFARGRFPKIAEDLCQIAWQKAFQHQWKEGDRLRPWLFEVVKNAGISEIRRRRTVPLDWEIPVQLFIADDDRYERLARCREQLRAQKPEWDQVIELFLNGEKPASAADRLGISRANFDQRKKRAIQALATCVGNDGGSA